LPSLSGEVESFSVSETFPPRRIKIEFHYHIQYLIQIIALVTSFILQRIWLTPKSLPCSPEPTYELYPERDEYSPNFTTFLLKIRCNIIFIFIQFMLSVTFRISEYNFYNTCAFSSRMRATCLSHFQILRVCLLSVLVGLLKSLCWILMTTRMN
jgi:hypothetical protein